MAQTPTPAPVAGQPDTESAKDKIILYDNPSRFGTGTCWSPNVWKTRLLLNFKGIPYTTEWIHAPFAAVAVSLSLEPRDPKDAIAPYTIPFIRLPDGTAIMESRNIAVALEERYYPPPRYPSAHLDHPIVARVEKLRNATLSHLQAVLVPRMPRECLTGPSAEYHRVARQKTYGMTLEEYEEKFGGERAWENAMPHLRELSEMLNEDDSGPFFLGSTPTYADLNIVAVLEWARCLRGGCLERFFEIDDSFKRLFEACRPWLQRNDY